MRDHNPDAVWVVTFDELHSAAGVLVDVMPTVPQCLGEMFQIDTYDEWIASDRRSLSEESMALLNTNVNTRNHTAIEGGK